ncbi:MAG: PD-(D/E)XK nuclease family protein [Cyanobacteria bacterium J06607_13]
MTKQLTYRDPKDFCQTVDGKHIYTIPALDGAALPSVSELLRCSDIEDQSGLEKWRLQVGQKQADLISARACFRGSVVHSMIEVSLLGSDDTQDLAVPESFSEVDQDRALNEARSIFEASHDVLDRVRAVEFCECAVWHDSLRYAGTLDCLAEFDGELSLIDWKTAGKQPRFRPTYPYQLCAYATALNRLEGRVVVSTGVSVVMSPTGAIAKKFDLAKYWPWWIEVCKRYWAPRDADRFGLICGEYEYMGVAA